jgi:hypothetical protein
MSSQSPDLSQTMQQETPMVANSRFFYTVLLCLAVAVSCVVCVGRGAENGRPPIRVGMVGLDTSHVIAFTKIINNPGATGDVADLKVVAGYRGGSPDFPLSRDRVDSYTRQIREMGVEIVASIEELLPRVDAVMIESNDGRPHLAQAKAVFRAGKPVFIDKPVAASLADVLEIYGLAKQHHAPCFSSSSLRYGPGLPDFLRSNRVGEILGCDAYSQTRAAPGHPDLFWYGVHGVEILYTVMGRGCVSVTRTQTPYSEQVTGTWQGGRIGTFRGIREHTGATGFGATLFGKKAVVGVTISSDYTPLLVEIARFFKTGKPPVSAEETIELFAFMEAAEESKRRSGQSVTLTEVLDKARAVVDSRENAKRVNRP